MQNDVTLSMIATEVERSLTEARSMLQSDQEATGGGDVLDRARRTIEQVRGALQVAQVAGATRVLLEIEQLLGEVTDATDLTPSGARVAEIRTTSVRGLGAVQEYVLALAAGMTQDPLVLAETMGELLAARGSDRLAELELFETNVTRSLPERARAADNSASHEFSAGSLRDLRAKFQKGLLEWLRGGADALDIMRDIVGQIHAEAPDPAPWWVATAFIEHVGSGNIKTTVHVKRVFARLDKYLARLCAGCVESPDALLREMLYFLSQGKPGSALVAEVRDHYELESGQSQAPAAPAAQDRKSESLVHALQELWESAVEGDVASAQALATRIAETSADLPDSLAPLLESVRRAAEVQAAESAPRAILALEVATALIVIAEAVGSANDSERMARAEAMNRRLQRLLQNDEDISLGSPELPSGSSQRDSLQAFGSELVSVFDVAEQQLSEYFADPDDTDAITAVQHALNQAHGALQVVGDDEAAAAVGYCIAEIGRLADTEVEDQQRPRSDLASVISALSFYAGHLGKDAVDLAGILARAGAPADVLTQQTAKPVQDSASADAGSFHDVGAAEPSLSSQGPEGSENALALRLSDHTLLAEDLQISGPDSRESSAQGQNDGEATDVDVPSDPELLSVFLEEADDVLSRMAETLRRLRDSWPDAEALLTLRRGFHTLKGSGRMVNLRRFSEVAHALEKLLDAHARFEHNGPEELLLLLDTALVRIRSWVEALQGEGCARIDTEELSQWAERIAQGGNEPKALNSKAGPLLVEETQGVAVGDVQLSRTLFEVFTAEAGRATKALADEFAGAEAVVDKATAHERFRLAHTLAGIAGTAGFSALRELAGALQTVLRHADEHEIQFSRAELEVCASVAIALLGMVEEITALHLPKSRPDLEAQLRVISQRQLAGAADGEAELADDRTPDSGEQHSLAAADTEVMEDGRVAQRLAVDELFGDTTGLLEVNSGVFTERRRRQRVHDDIDATLLPAFLEEAAELVPQIGEALRRWRADPRQPNRHEALTRLLHTFKGSARMAGAMALGELTHSMEARIVTAAELPIIPDTLIDGLETSFDRMGVLLERLSQPATPAAEADADALPARPSLRVRVDLLERLATEAGELATSRSSVEGQVRAIRGQVREMGSTIEQLRFKVRELEIQAESQIQSRLVRADESEASLDPLELDRFTRLQELTRLIEENANDVTLLQQTIARDIDNCDGALVAQERMTRVLQDSLVNVRMVPFSTLNERLYRVVRLTARDSGRQAALDIRGSGASLDRGVVDRIAAPLEHLLRNAVVHGIETPEERRAAGKPQAGEIVLDVSQEGNEVVLVLQDDGRGLDLERLRTRAVTAGRIAPDATVSPEQLAQLAFEPGVSTAAEVSASAGRGVGLDVVRNEVAAVGGRIDVSFEPGKGTVFTVRLPLTMTVMQVLVMRCAGRLFAVPAMMVEQVRTLKPQALETVCQSGAVDWQSRRYPLHDLRDLLGFGNEAREVQPFTPIVLLRGGAQRAAIRIDELVAHEEVVIKELGSQLSSVTGMVGAAVRGGGEIVLILNPIRLAQVEPVPMPLSEPQPGADAEQASPATTVLIVDDSLTVRKITNRVLARNGYRVLEARDGVEALERLEVERPKIVLLDAEMPRMDGFEVLRRMRSDPIWQGLPVMMITSRTADKHRNHAMQLGASAFLGKPFEEQQLLARVAELIEKAAA